MGTIHEVAKRAGVSTSTVSRTFRAPNSLRTETEQRVLEAARQLNYRPHRARMPQQQVAVATPSQPLKAHDSVGFQFFSYDDVDSLMVNEFYGPVLSAAVREAATLGMNVILNTTDRHAVTTELPKMIRDQDISGLMLVGNAGPELLSAFVAKVPHIVLMDNDDESGLSDSIVTDGFGGTYKATRYLVEVGHKRIGFLLGDPGESAFVDRFRGYQAGCLEAGLSLDSSLVLLDAPQGGPSREIEEYLKQRNRPTAMITANDKYARLVMAVCRKLGIGIPNELSLIGFDDVQRSHETDPPLTTLSVDKDALGRLGVRRLWTRMHVAKLGLPQEPAFCIKLPASLVLRESCARPMSK